MIKHRKIHVYVLSFIMPIIILGLVYLKFGMYPFGNHTLLICDLNGQYADFYSAYYDILTEGKSLLYSWQAGLGLNFLGIFAYYLASPFSLLIVFFAKKQLTEALLLITLLKTGTSGLTFSLYGKSVLKAPPVPLLLCSVLYALASYSVVYSFNLMWLDGVVLLPLILLGTEKILQKNKALFLILSLMLSFIANFYVAYMTGIFSFLYFSAAFFSKHTFKELRLFGRKLLAFCSSALLAAGCAAILLVPAYYALKNGNGGADLSSFQWKINFKLLDLLSKTQLGAYDTLKNEGLPNIYCGLLPLLILPLYFFNQKIPRRERIIYLSLLGLLIFSFNLSGLDLLWHGFDSPNWFPYRYSFVFSFLLLFLTLKQFNQLKYSDLPGIAKSAAAWIILIMIVQKINYPHLPDYLLTTGIFLLGIYSLLLAGLLRSAKTQKKILLYALTGLVLLESSLNTWSLIKGMDREFRYTTKEEYTQTLSKMKALIPEIPAMSENFYRLDRIGGRTYNDPLNLGYNGVAHFSSMSNMGMIKSLRQLGFLSTAADKSVDFAGSTPITESLLGIKYVISGHDKELGYLKVLDKGELSLYENKYVLPIGFLVSSCLLALDPSKDDNPFRLQNTLLNLALGHSENTYFNDFNDYFLPLSIKKVKLTNAAITYEKGQETVGKTAGNQTGSMEFILINPRGQQVYACFQTINNPVRIFVNEEEIKDYLPVYNKRIVDLGFHPRNKELSIKLSFDESFTLSRKYFYGLSEKNLAKALAPLKKGVLENVYVTDTTVRGNVAVDDNSLLFTSIPFDPGWTVYVDGRKTSSVFKIGNAFLGVELPLGKHDIFFTFQPQGLRLGMAISGISLLLLLGFMIKGRVWRRPYTISPFPTDTH